MDGEDRNEPLPTDALHVLVIAYFCDPTRGSEPGIAWNWIRSLSQHCRVSVITRELSRGPIEAYLESNELTNAVFHYVDAPPGFRAWTWGKLYYPRWQQRVNRVAVAIHETNPFDLVHHLTVASISYPSFLHLPVPLVIGPIGGGEAWPRSFRSGTSPSSTFYEMLRTVRRRTLRYDPFTRALLARCRLVLAATPETERVIASTRLCQTTSFPMAGIEKDFVVPERDPDLHSGCRFYAVGRLLGWKGFDLAVEAFARIAKRWPAASFTLYGDGPERAVLERLSQRLGVARQVHFAGWLPRDVMIRQALSNDVFLFPSLRDSGGVAVLEAMASGKPVVCFDAGGPALMVTPDCGMMISVTTPSQAVSDLAEAMEELASNPALRTRLGRSARERVLDEFLWERKAEYMVNVYRGILGSRIPPTAEGS